MKTDKISKLFIFLFFLGIFIRIYLLLRPGFLPDMLDWQKWTISIGQGSIFRIYTRDSSINYPPVYLFVLWFISFVIKLYNVNLQFLNTQVTSILKIPTLIFDLATTVIIISIAKIVLKNKTPAKAAGLLYFLNPAVMYAGSAWGQVDSFPVFFLLLSTLCYFQKKPFFSGLWYAFAISTKFQSVVLIPWIVFLLFKKSQKFLQNFIIGIFITITLIHLPFILNGQGERLLDIYLGSIGFVTSYSHNAWNLWWPMQKIVHTPDTSIFLQLINIYISYRTVGLFLLTTSILFACLKTQATVKPIEYFSLLLFIFFSFFMLPTQIHERYLYPVVAYMPILVIINKQFRYYFIVISILFLLNLLYVFPLHEVVGRGFSWTTIIYKEEFTIYCSIAFMIIYIFFSKRILNKTK